MPDAISCIRSSALPATALSAAGKKPGKNIVVFCDGTGNEFGEFNSNVVRLYTACKIDNEQVGYYHPGVGTMGSPEARGWLGKKWSALKGLAFAAGFKDNVLDAYRFLMNVYDDGDRVFLFGFSRGAYTARALAGLLHGYGLLCRGNEGHIPYAWQQFVDELKKKKADEKKGGDAAHYVHEDTAFKETFSNPQFELHFVGLWDTVSSVGWISTPLRLLYVAQNSTIRRGRHAISIDERRCFYQDNLWGDPQPGQDILQVWFAGVHSDVGGGYARPEAQLADTALCWMLGEATAAGLQVDTDRVRLIFGEPTEQPYAAASLYAPPPAYFPIHHSLKGIWWLLELFPHRYFNRDDGKEKWRIPLGQHRALPYRALVHPSVVARMQGHPEYAPVNAPLRDLVRLEANPPELPRQADPLQPSQPPGTAADLAGFYQYLPTGKPA